MKSADGKRTGSKFRMGKYDKARGKDENTGGDGGQRAEANKLSAKPSMEQEEKLEEQIHPGIHDEVSQVAAQHGPAHEVHVMHDHAAGRHAVHSVHPDGHQHQSEHADATEAHKHAAILGGAGEPEEAEGEYPQEHESGGDEYPME